MKASYDLLTAPLQRQNEGEHTSREKTNQLEGLHVELFSWYTAVLLCAAYKQTTVYCTAVQQQYGRKTANKSMQRHTVHSV